MSECFNTEELLANVRKLANENDDLRDQVGEWRAKAEEATAYAQEKDRSMERMRVENSALLRQLEEVQKRLCTVTHLKDSLKHKLAEKENLSVKDFMETLSQNGAQSVLIGFK